MGRCPGTIGLMVTTMPGPADAPVEAPPVFVDDTGRRRRRAIWVGRSIGACFLAYFVLFAAGLARAPWVPRVSLPGVGALLPGSAPQAPPLGSDATVTPAPDLSTTSRQPTGQTGAPGGASQPTP